ncbi:MAG: hypothetical protein SPI77_09240 [Corynebacterium sp.]|nr:hypothetical protein [Corynebacterium sp.]
MDQYVTAMGALQRFGILLATKRLLGAKKGTYLPHPDQLSDYAAALHDDPGYAEYRYAQTIPSGFSQYELEQQ